MRETVVLRTRIVDIDIDRAGSRVLWAIQFHRCNQV